MPFTFSHPAIILPLGYLNKNLVSFTGLFIGSIAPDFEYFIRMSDASSYSHTWPGLFWFDLPLAIVLCFIYHNIVRNPLLQNLPPVFLSRTVRYFNFKWNSWFYKKWLVILVSVLIGGASHILWDQVTHETSDTLIGTSYIKGEIDFSHKDLMIYYGFWGLNSLIGGALLIYSFWKLPRTRNFERTSPSKYYWVLNLIIFLVVFTWRIVAGNGMIFIDYVDSAIAAFLIAIIISSFLLKTTFNKRKEAF